MKFCKLNGKTVYKNISKYLIKWDGESKSKLQFSVKQFLKPFWSRCVCYEEMPLAGTKLSLDIVNLTKGIAVEVHGDQHKDYVKYFHGNREGFVRQIERDVRTGEWCQMNNLLLVEIYTDDFPLKTEWFKEYYDITL